MANYSLVANSTFQPFSYQELIVPIDRQNAYHEKLMDEYDKLSSQADVLEAMGANDRDKDSKVYQQYKNYSDRLRTEADNLYRNGLNTESRMRLSELRRMYNTDIVPIQNAWQKREKEAELQMKAQLDASSKGIDLYFSRNAADTPLQSYIDNPNQTFRTINGQALMNEVAAQFKAMANQVQVDKNGNPWIGKQQLSPIEYSIITQKGMDYNQYMDFINNPNDPRFANIRSIVNGTLAAHGAQDFDSTTQQRLFGLASQGVAAGVGDRDMQFHTDPYEQAMLTYDLDIKKEREKAKIAAEAAGGGDMPNIPSVAVGLVPTETYKTKNLEALNSLKGGKDGLKASYFGTTFGKVNPMAIYDEYKEELSKVHTPAVKPTLYGPQSERDNASAYKAKVKEKVLKKYAKYGVTDILSDDQYKALSDVGYSSKKNINSVKHSDILQEFNKSVEQKSRYSTNMTSYDNFNDTAIPNLNTRAKYSDSVGTVWAITEDGKLGKPESVKKLKLYSADNTKGNKITDVQYDPSFKGKIVIQLSDGSLHVADPNIYNSNLANLINRAEAEGAHPQAITARMYDFLNKKNKIQSNTDSKVE